MTFRTSRMSIFNIINHSWPEKLLQTRVLDVFAGTGALGLEALSRGAQFALFMETGVEGRGVIRTNIEAFGLTGNTKIFRRDATKPGEPGTVPPFDLVFADPPYGKGMGQQAMLGARNGGWLAPDAMIVWEENTPMNAPAGFQRIDKRKYGDTHVTLLRNMA